METIDQRNASEVPSDPTGVHLGPSAITPHHARYYALDLRCRQHKSDVSAVGAALFDAQVDLNPHQIEAALFGARATIEQGRLLADEVGLGKTIEAALVLSQCWAERRRRLLIIAPAALRRQWASELEEKFGLPVVILDGKSTDGGNPFDQRAVVVCSYQYVAKRVPSAIAIPWDLVVVDEAHRLRNAWKSSSATSRALVDALAKAPTLLLTATPLQNSLLEVYGLVSLIAPNVLGDEGTFRARFMKTQPRLEELRMRLDQVCKRTLRRDVLPYIRYTARRPMTWRFASSDLERALYRDVTTFLARDDLHSLPKAQRPLIMMVLRKLLASSSTAIAGALATLRERLVATIAARTEARPATPISADDFDDEGLDEDWLDELTDDLTRAVPSEPSEEATHKWTEAQEIAALDGLIATAHQIPIDRRAVALVAALEAAFVELGKLGAQKKAVVFTESRLTQERLRSWLEANGYAGKIVTFNGSNADEHSRATLDAWLVTHPDHARTGSRSANMRAALVDAFRDRAQILIATEAGAEGLNLQFCSLVVNYDLPWNPQRVEQRIGRCHRYGQAHDVVVVNFLDKDNQADKRVLELLTDKLGLFEGVFGASDAVLGAVESGVGFERKIHRIFATCRTPDAIESAFAVLRKEMDEVIKAEEKKAKKALFEHFDDTIHDRLRLQLDVARARLDRMGRQFWALTRWALDGHAHFASDTPSFDLTRLPADVAGRDPIPLGTYELVQRGQQSAPEALVHRLSHPLGEYVLDRGQSVATPAGVIVFDASHHPLKVSVATHLIGKSGWLVLQRLTVRGLSDEEHLLLAGFVVEGERFTDVDAETLDRLFSIGGHLEALAHDADAATAARLTAAAERLRAATIAQAAERNRAEFDEARDRLDRWATDQVQAAEANLDELRLELRALERRARTQTTLDDQHQIQRAIAETETKQRRARDHMFKVEDEVRDRRRQLLDELERRMAQNSRLETIFSAAWRVT